MTNSILDSGPLKLARGILICLMLLSAPQSRGEMHQSQADEAIRSISETVPNANMIFIFDGVAEQRQSDVGQTMTRLLDDVGVTASDGTLSLAWSELSQKIGLTNAEAFDRFFGHRAIFVSEGMTIAGGGEWAIATVVPSKLAFAVLKSLGAKHRDIEAGHTIFAIEDGAYRITLVRPSNDAGGGSDARIFVVAPRASKNLFRWLVRGLSKPKGWTELVGQNRKLKPQIAGVFRADGQEVGFINILQTDQGWHGQAILEAAELIQQSQGWTKPHLDAIAAGAWLALTDEVDPVALLSTPIGSVLQLEPDQIASLSEHVTQRVAITIRPARQGVSIMAAVETDGTAEAAVAADSTMQGISGFLAGKQDATPDYQGFMPHATRTTNIDGFLTDEFLGSLIGKRPNLSWLVQHGTDSNWWVLRLGPTTGHEGVALRSLANAMPKADEGGQNISLGVARPGPLAAMVDLVVKSERPIEKPFRLVESIQWSERLRPGKSEIRFEFRMNGSND
jgi:hypothetical protein